ncbi:sugar kinase [candidate division KSB1 bacterium]|nr:sugar kinase [candidate division KSB1 bacterium]
MKVVTFGEIMGCLNTKGYLTFKQALPGGMNMTFAGAETNIAASLSMLGAEAEFVTALPGHDVADACIAALHAVGVGAQFIVQTQQGRLGLYFVETGANQRPSKVIYHRAGSSVSMTRADQYAWDEAFKDPGCFHTKGITPALSEIAAEAACHAAKAAKEAGLMVSCDLNFRKKLWRWKLGVSQGALAGQTMRRLLPHVDVVIGNEEDAADVLSVRAGDMNVYAGHLEIDTYPKVAEKIIEQFPNVSKVTITLRESLSASHNNWGAMLYDRDRGQACFAPVSDGKYRPYAIKNIVDRVGDAFGAGLIYSVNSNAYADMDKAVAFAAAASCLAHSIVGDFNYSTRTEVESLMQGSGSGRVVC